ncbi:GNAT family N-acetyltransferase [Streptomyces sp. JJ38]|uniref:GNAT family N-acetyltransferase n=1 Tax=Streptomyces sp. JJ38 TaxID=2738128 RepID=UPI001C5A43C3|nr:GNAT family N-acetyltransferase [Streptomyces sp. JJ38]MBW1599544.1 GNAT family N-acetyltransferase [Streptomyces sp. JJ38]
MSEHEKVRWLRAAYDARLRGWCAPLPSGAREERDGPLLRVVGLHEGFVIGPRDLGVRGEGLDRLIGRQRDFFAARGEAVEWKTHGHDLPEDLPARLRAAGFLPEPPETVVIGEAARIAGIEAEPPPGVTLRTVSAPEDLERFAQMQSEVWGRDLSHRARELGDQRAVAPDAMVLLVAEAAGEVVCAARMTYVAGGAFAGLWGGSTLAAWRGRGIYRAMVAARARMAAERGVRHLYVEASADSAPILRRLGFVAVTTTTPYLWSPPAPRRG